jgi:hypothetical protein
MSLIGTCAVWDDAPFGRGCATALSRTLDVQPSARSSSNTSCQIRGPICCHSDVGNDEPSSRTGTVPAATVFAGPAPSPEADPPDGTNSSQ